MKVRGTTTFSIETELAPAEMLALVREVLTAFRQDNEEVLVAEATSGGEPGDKTSLELSILFRSDSYATVETAMQTLASRLTSSLKTGSPPVRMAGRETQLVPA